MASPVVYGRAHRDDAAGDGVVGVSAVDRRSVLCGLAGSVVWAAATASVSADVESGRSPAASESTGDERTDDGGDAAAAPPTEAAAVHQA